MADLAQGRAERFCGDVGGVRAYREGSRNHPRRLIIRRLDYGFDIKLDRAFWKPREGRSVFVVVVKADPRPTQTSYDYQRF